jgi:single-strand DNA-binding protein
MLNTVIIEGRLTKDPELKTTPNGISVSTFAVAVARDYKNANGEYDSDFFECVAWRNNAERISKYFHKGDGVGIVGRLQTRTYKDKNGVNRKAIEIIAESIHFPVGSKKSNATASAPVANDTGASAGATPQYENVDLSDEDLPF